MQQEQQNSRADGSVGLVDYLQVIVTYRKMISVITVVAFVVAVVYSLLATKWYRATAKILPPQQDQSLMAGFLGQMGGGMASLASGLFAGSSPSDLYVGMLQSETVSDAIIKRFKLKEVYGSQFRADTYVTLNKKVQFEAGRKDGIISITVEDKDPQRAAEMANAFAEELGKLTVSMSREGAGVNRSFVEERLSKAKGALEEAAVNLKNFQARNKAIDVSEQAKATIAGLSELKARLAAQEVQLAAFRRQFTDDSQEVKNQSALVTNLKSQITKLEGSGNGGALLSVGSVPALGQEYIRLMREFKTQEAIVELLTKQYELHKLNESKKSENLQILQKASIPDKRIKPKRGKIVIALTCSALFIAIILAFIRESVSRMSEQDKARWLDLKKSFYRPS